MDSCFDFFLSLVHFPWTGRERLVVVVSAPEIKPREGRLYETYMGEKDMDP